MADKILYMIRRSDLSKLAGRHITDDEAERFAKAFPYTSVNECIDGCLFSIVELPGDKDDEALPGFTSCAGCGMLFKLSSPTEMQQLKIHHCGPTREDNQ